ncbi:hypothetical protein KM043_000855 [Ampulex compressa]|nr:hypothetical protein KM043_000855 [Ampulex compressa]
MSEKRASAPVKGPATTTTCDIEFQRAVIGVSGYLVETRYAYLPTRRLEGLPRTRRPSAPLLFLLLLLLLLLLLAFPSAKFGGVSNVLPSCGLLHGVRLPLARFTAN